MMVSLHYAAENTAKRDCLMFEVRCVDFATGDLREAALKGQGN